MSSSNKLKVLSPAKINLILKVLGQRQDGYHLLQTYFQLLNWGDSMQFCPLKEDIVNIKGKFHGLDIKYNLIYKALELLRPYRKVKTGIDIKVNKIIPQGSGLGGGSSNAATTLLMMNDLWNCQLNNFELQQLGLTLGADVPVFILNRSAMAEGIGEKLTPYMITPYYYVLIFPPSSIATKDVFENKTLIRNDKAILNYELLNNSSNWSNTCLPVVLDHYPEVKSYYTIANNLSPTYMSGTGSTLFCAFENLVDAKKFIKLCPQEWNLQISKAK